LIEECGWKGKRENDAGVHQDHALILVNYGKASGSDILGLAGKIQASVMEKFGLWLEPEVIIV
jgi:UDP-N-acetylmuramate dehydrogenase